MEGTGLPPPSLSANTVNREFKLACFWDGYVGRDNVSYDAITVAVKMVKQAADGDGFLVPMETRLCSMCQTC